MQPANYAPKGETSVKAKEINLDINNSLATVVFKGRSAAVSRMRFGLVETSALLNSISVFSPRKAVGIRRISRIPIIEVG